MPGTRPGLLLVLLPAWGLGCSWAGGSEGLGWGLQVRLPTLVPGRGAESVLEFVFISIYCCWECRGGLCGGSEVMCSSFPVRAE